MVCHILTPFIRKTNRTVIRTRAALIRSPADLDGIVSGVVTTTRLGWIPFVIAGVAQPAVSRKQESYNTSVLFEDFDSRTVWNVCLGKGGDAHRDSTRSTPDLLGNTAIATVVSG